MGHHPNRRFSAEKLMNYLRVQKYPVEMFCSGWEDYIAYRCLSFNALPVGLTLATQAIEKILKALIYLETGKETQLKRNDRHNPLKLKQELQKTRDYGLDRFDELLKRLYGHFQSRYFDNPDRSTRKSGSEIHEVDEIWLLLVEMMPVPEEAKYSLYPFALLFEENYRKHWRYYAWLTKDNKSVTPSKLRQMELRYRQVQEHLHPSTEGKWG